MSKNFYEVCIDEFKNFEGWTLSEITLEDEETYCLLFTRQVENVVLGCEVLLKSDDMHVCPWYVLDIVTQSNTGGDLDADY